MKSRLKRSCAPVAAMLPQVALATAGCSSGHAIPDAFGAPESGTFCDPTAFPAGTTVALGSPLPDLAFSNDAMDGGVVSLRSFAEPCAEVSKLLVLRVVTGWCGTCRWHASHTARLLPEDLRERVHLVDLLLANDNNQIATALDLASYRAHGDGLADAVADPSNQLGGLFDDRPALPLYLLVDARTLVPKVGLANPGPDTLANAFRATLAAIDGVPAPAPVPIQKFDDRFTADAWDMIAGMVLVQPPPPDPTNHVADDAQAAALGLQYFETFLFSPRQVGCISCHNPSLLLTDGKETPPEGAGPAPHNVPSIILAGYRKWLAWNGAADSLWMLALLPVELDFEFASSRLYLAHAIFDNYRSDYQAVFGPMPPLNDMARFPKNGMPGSPEWAGMNAGDQQAVTRILVNMGKAIAAYLRSLRVAPHALDNYAAGHLDALTSKEKDGLAAFFVSGCAQCHYGPRLTDDSFHNLRFPTGRADRLPDTGRADGIPFLLGSEFRRTGAFSDAPAPAPSPDLVATPNLVGAFKTPDLRGVGFTLPYGHGGSYGGLLSTLEAHRTAGLPAGSPLTMGVAEKFLVPFDPALEAPMIDFLNTLRLDMLNPPPASRKSGTCPLTLP